MFSVTECALGQSKSLVNHKRGYSPEVVSKVIRGQPSTIRLKWASTVAEIRTIVLHVTLSRSDKLAMTHVNTRVQRHRDALRIAGLRPVQIWVPDTRRPGFAKECRRQSRLVAQADVADTDMQHFMDEALSDMDGWTK